jgi:hypothetical protein
MSDMFNILGARLAQAIGREEAICRGLLRLSVLDRLQQLQPTADTGQVMVYIRQMAFRDWQAVLEGPVLARRLKNIGVAEPANVVDQLQGTLVETQSLLAISAH